MSNQEQYITITHYKEREFYFLNYAVQTEDGFIARDIEQFHESDKLKFIERIRELQSKYPNNHIVSISLVANQTVSQYNDKHRATAKIFQDTFVSQYEIDVGDVPTTLYFSPFAILYEYYKDVLNDKLTLFIGYFDRKLFMMFATDDKIHQSWIIGTRGLTEKQIAKTVYKSMQVYYKISYNFADHIEMLVAEENPKLFKFLREELSLHIELAQSNIHNLLHHMASSQKIAQSSFIKPFKKIEIPKYTVSKEDKAREYRIDKPSSTDGNRGVDGEDVSLMDKFKSLFGSTEDTQKASILATILPMLLVLVIGLFFQVANRQISHEIYQKDIQIKGYNRSVELANVSNDIFKAMGKNGELVEASISSKAIDLKGIVWGIEPLKSSLKNLYSDGKFSIKPLENFMTEFSFISNG